MVRETSLLAGLPSTDHLVGVAAGEVNWGQDPEGVECLAFLPQGGASLGHLRARV